MRRAIGADVSVWENPPWSNKLDDDRSMLLQEVVRILSTMTPQERAKILQEFPADEVIAVAELLESLEYE